MVNLFYRFLMLLSRVFGIWFFILIARIIATGDLIENADAALTFIIRAEVSVIANNIGKNTRAVHAIIICAIITIVTNYRSKNTSAGNAGISRA